MITHVQRLQGCLKGETFLELGVDYVAIMNSSNHEAKILWSSSPTHKVRAIGWKFSGDSVWIRQRIPLHQIGERWLVKIIFENQVVRK